MAADLTIATGEVRLAVRDHSGAGPDLLLAHGLSSNLAIWEPVVPHLEGFRVVAYDQRGHGYSSDPDDWSYESLADDARTVASALAMHRPVMVGHSWGASVALHVAATDPDCPGVVCVDGGLFDLQGMGLSWEAAAEMLRPPELSGPRDEILERVRTEQAFLPWDVLEPVVERSRILLPDGTSVRRTPIDQHMRIVRAMWEERTWELYERIEVPVLLVLARGVRRNPREEGFVAAKEAAAARIGERPNVRVEWLESVHDIPLVHPRELATLVAGFARGVR